MRTISLRLLALGLLLPGIALANSGSAPPLASDCIGKDQDPLYVQTGPPPVLWVCNQSTGWVALDQIIPAGPQGPQGEPGPTGSTGPQGPAGNDGATGSQGPQGTAGNDGATGAQGPQGNAGAQGPQGIQGPAGADGGGLPAGVIVMWPGTLASIPSGWALCDGQAGRPDLRGVFPKGTAAGVDPGATGGSLTHGHAYSDNLQHSHAVNVNDPGHDHVENQNSTTTGPNIGWAARDTSTNSSTATGYSTASAPTGVTATTSDPAGSVATGNTQTTNHEPPFVTVAFICKT